LVLRPGRVVRGGPAPTLPAACDGPPHHAPPSSLPTCADTPCGRLREAMPPASVLPLWGPVPAALVRSAPRTTSPIRGATVADHRCSRCRHGRPHHRRGAAGSGLRRNHHPRRRGGPPPLRAPSAVQGGPDREGLRQ